MNNERDLSLTSHVSLSDVQGWHSSPRLRLVLGNSLSFDVGALGVAMAKLHAFHSSGARINVDVQKSPPSSIEDFEKSFWCSPLGFLLFVLATDTYVAGKAVDLQPLKRLAYDYYRRQLGGIGRGNQIHWLSIDPAIPLPPILPLDEALGFPTPSEFSKLIRTSVGRLGSTALSSISEQPIASFIYETARNSHEHGRVNDEGSVIRGIRSISFERLSFTNKEDLEHRSLPAHLKTYFAALFDQPRFQKQVICVSVLDQGRGIPRTLGALPEERPVGTIKRAFKEGESSKPQGEVNRGLGLSNALFAAKYLGALLQIFSDGVLAYQDFLNPDDKYPSLAPVVISEAQLAQMPTGSVFTLVIPQNLNPDQEELFWQRHG